jgi:transcriptional regulator with XRE-family HTH domain
MSIGESLAEARRQAGLSVYEVSRKTRVREPIIRGIERDDYSACGGDFYARGHIRLIARAVGADPEPLIREYDATVQSHEPVTAADLFRPVTPIRVREPQPRRPWMAAFGLVLVLVIGFAAYKLISGTRHAPPANPAAAIKAGSSTHHRGTLGTGHPAPTPAAVPPYAHEVVVNLTASQDCWVGFTTPGGGFLTQAYVVAGTSRSWTFGYPVQMRLGNPGGISLTVNGRNPLSPGTTNPITLSLGLGGSISTGG